MEISNFFWFFYEKINGRKVNSTWDSHNQPKFEQKLILLLVAVFCVLLVINF